MYLDSFGFAPGRSNPLLSLYRRHITTKAMLEFRVGGLGADKEAKVGKSNELGRAACRWFMEKQFGFAHFGRIDQLIANASRHHLGVKVARKTKGDTPDYLCSNPNSRKIELAEAKGRQSGSISFGDANFKRWRKQFGRVTVKDRYNTPLRVKGTIVAIRARIQGEPVSVQSSLYAEDPELDGERTPDDGELRALERMIENDHYSRVFERLNLPLEASSLRDSFEIRAEEPRPQVWECLASPLFRRRFVGVAIEPDEPPEDSRYVYIEDGDRRIHIPLSRRSSQRRHIWLDNVGHVSEDAVFFGLEENVFQNVLRRTQRPYAGADDKESDLPPAVSERTEAPDNLPSDVSFHGDGTLMAPIYFMRPVRE